MADQITYGELIEMLKRIGYSQSTMPWNGTNQWVFRHNKVESAIIHIAEQPLDKPLHPFHANSVRTTLKVHGVVEEDPLALLKATLDRKSSKVGPRQEE